MTALNGCDSVITISLIFLAATQHAIEYTGCVGDNYSIIVNDTVYNESNPTGMVWLTGSNGCDSVVIVNMVFGNQFVVNEIYNGCECDGYSILVNGNLYDEQHPLGMENISGVSGCDTLVYIDLLFAPASTSSFTYSGCAGDGFGIIVNGTSYDEQHPNGVEAMTNVHGCDSTITIALTFVDPDSNSISYTGCVGDGYAVMINGISYNESNPIGTEMVQTADGCDSIIQIALMYEDCDVQDFDCAVFIPNVISPNDDGINDEFSFGYATSCEVTGFRVTVYDRWGSELYSSTDTSFKWKGEFKDKQLQPGVFVYIAEIYFKDASAPVIRRGDVTLIW
jgi:gliding motility-associated-like protein